MISFFFRLYFLKTTLPFKLYKKLQKNLVIHPTFFISISIPINVRVYIFFVISYFLPIIFIIFVFVFCSVKVVKIAFNLLANFIFNFDIR